MMAPSQDIRLQSTFQRSDQPIYCSYQTVQIRNGCHYYPPVPIVVVPPEPRNSTALPDCNWRRKSTASENQVFHNEEIRGVCFLCKSLNKKQFYHRIFDIEGKIVCPVFMSRLGCSICEDKKSSPHIEIDCPKYKNKDDPTFKKAAAEFKGRQVIPARRPVSFRQQRGNLQSFHKRLNSR